MSNPTLPTNTTGDTREYRRTDENGVIRIDFAALHAVAFGREDTA